MGENCLGIYAQACLERCALIISFLAVREITYKTALQMPRKANRIAREVGKVAKTTPSVVFY
jgi:hypothetical protein